jgi:hypothetical protein
VTTHKDILNAACGTDLNPVFRDLGFTAKKGLRWRRRDLEVRAVFDSKSGDAFRGGAFTLEFERSADGRFEAKLAGRVRVEQLLDASQRQQFLELGNAVAARLPNPDAAFLETVPEPLRQEYLKAFTPQRRLGTRPWMRFNDAHDAHDWCALLRRLMPALVDRADRIDPHKLVLGKTMDW